MAQDLQSRTFSAELGDRFDEFVQIDLQSREEVDRAVNVAIAYIEREKTNLFLSDAYKNKYVAVIGERIVDVDEDEAELYFRVVKTYPQAMAVLKGIGLDEEEWDDDDELVEVPLHENMGR